MHPLKHANMLANFHGHHGPQTIKRICALIPDVLFAELTGRQLGMVMDAVQASWEDARAIGQGAEELTVYNRRDARAQYAYPKKSKGEVV